MKNILFVFLAFSLFSCTDIKKTEQISAINKMFTSLDSIETVLFNNEIFIGNTQPNVLKLTKALQSV